MAAHVVQVEYLLLYLYRLRAFLEQGQIVVKVIQTPDSILHFLLKFFLTHEVNQPKLIQFHGSLRISVKELNREE